MNILGLNISWGKRASLENPSTPLSQIAEDDDVWDAITGGATSDTGVKVTRRKALTYDAYWRGVNLVSSDAAKLGIFVMKRDGEGKVRDAAHAAYQLLRYKPNREMTAFVFVQTLVSHVLIEGNGYAYIARRGDGSPTELIPLIPECNTTYPVRANGVLYYITHVNGEPRKLPASDVLHLKGLGFDGLVGYSVLDMAKESIGLGLGTRKYGSVFFKRDATPGVVLEHPGKLSPDARKQLRKEWDEIHAGLDNARRTAVLWEGMKANAMSVNARDSQLIETRQFEVKAVANFIGVPPHKLGDSSRTAYASLEQENQSYLDEALDPRLVMIEHECRDKLLSEDEKRTDSHVIEFNRQALLRADMAARGEFYTKATGGMPWMTVNEVRGRENQNPQAGFGKIMIPTNNFGGKPPAGKQKQSEPSAFISADVITAVRDMAIDAVTRMSKRLSIHLGKVGENREAAIEKQRPVLIEALTPVVAAIASVGGRSMTPADAAQALFDSHNSTTPDKPEAIVDGWMNGDTHED